MEKIAQSEAVKAIIKRIMAQTGKSFQEAAAIAGKRGGNKAARLTKSKNVAKRLFELSDDWVRSNPEDELQRLIRIGEIKKSCQQFLSEYHTKKAEDLSRALTLVKFAQQRNLDPEEMLKQAGIGDTITRLALRLGNKAVQAGSKVNLFKPSTVRNMAKTVQRIGTYAKPADALTRSARRMTRLSGLKGQLGAERGALDVLFKTHQPSTWNSRILNKSFKIPGTEVVTKQPTWNTLEELRKFLPDATPADLAEHLGSLTSVNSMGRAMRLGDLSNKLTMQGTHINNAMDRLKLYDQAVRQYSNPLQTLFNR